MVHEALDARQKTIQTYKLSHIPAQKQNIQISFSKKDYLRRHAFLYLFLATEPPHLDFVFYLS